MVKVRRVMENQTRKRLKKMNEAPESDEPDQNPGTCARTMPSVTRLLSVNVSSRLVCVDGQAAESQS